MPGTICPITGDSDATIGVNDFTTGKRGGDQFQPDYHI
jgi:hypothetical protein